MTASKMLEIARKLAASPTKYDNRTSRWASWVLGRWLMDCCRSIKAILWGFCFAKLKEHGGAKCGRGYPDLTTEGMIAHCEKVSNDMSPEAITPGELLHFKNHVGLYLGDGEVFECAPSLKGCAITKLNYQPWTSHGFIREIDYEEQPSPAPAPEPEKPILKEGEKLTLVNEPLYASSKKEQPANHVTGTFYETDGKLYNGRIRICNKPEYIGQVDKVYGWIDWRY